jgi:putative phosphoribosyl transferase
MPFQDRRDAGARLGLLLADQRGGEGPSTGMRDPVVLGLPRGGVMVAAEVARLLRLPLDVILVRKLGVPDQPELAMGAVGEDGARIVDESLIRRCAVSPAQLTDIEAAARAEMSRQAALFREGRPRVELTGRAAILIDDGVATGATAAVACLVARLAGAVPVILAVPVASPRSVRQLADVADRVVCLEAPSGLMAVGQAYRDFSQTTDAEVVSALRDANAARSGPTAP